MSNSGQLIRPVTQKLLGVNPWAGFKNHDKKNKDPIFLLNSFYLFFKKPIDFFFVKF